MSFRGVINFEKMKQYSLFDYCLCEGHVNIMMDEDFNVICVECKKLI